MRRHEGFENDLVALEAQLQVSESVLFSTLTFTYKDKNLF
jgi:hypothetical protein